MEGTQLILDDPSEIEDINICKRCGRKLKNEKSRQLGYGLSCYKKFIMETYRRRLFNVRKVINK